MLDPDAAAILEAIRTAGLPSFDQMTPEQARTAYNAGRQASTGPLVELPEIRDLTVPADWGALPCRLYRPVREGRLPLLVFFHGGGWVLGSIASHEGLCRRLAQAAGIAILSVEYRLAPEHPFPAAFNDARTAFDWARRNAEALGIDPERIGVGGDSAGGNLAAALCLAQREGGEPMPAAQVLLYPALDFVMDSASHREFAGGYVLTRPILDWFRAQYLPATLPPDDWRASPLRAASLEGLPPAVLLTAGYDPLRDEGEAYGRRLYETGIPVTLVRIPGQIHGFLPMDKVMRAAVPITGLLARHVRAALA